MQIQKVSPFQIESGKGQRLTEKTLLPGGKIVVAHHMMPEGKETIRKVTANETGGSSNEIVHNLFGVHYN